MTMRERKYKDSIERSSEWSKEHMRTVSFRFNKESDKDVIERLDSVPNKTDYVRSLVRKDIGK